jgi:alpha-ribazole phosphatase
MSIYLVRHTTPLVAKGICYGHADIDVTESFAAEAAIIKRVVPENAEQVYSSPLVRCRKLAEHLYPAHSISWEPDLRELNCGEWELQHWDALPREVIDPWMNDFVNVCIPGGESYVQLHERVIKCFERMAASPRPVVAVMHGGVIRSILAHLTNTPLKDSFGKFKPHYGCVIKVDGTEYQFLSNIPTEKEQHKPSQF